MDNEHSIEWCHERINQLEDTLGTVLAYLEGDQGYENAKSSIVAEIKSLIEMRPRNHAPHGT